MTGVGGSDDRSPGEAGRPAIHGVLVTYRRPADLEIMFRLLGEQERRLDSLVVVDNDPAESARTLVEGLDASEGPSVTYLASGDNVGPAGGIALGMRHVLSHAAEHDWVLPLDDDDPPRRPDMLAELERLATHLRAHEHTVGAVGVVGARFDATQGRVIRVSDDELAGAVPADWLGSGHFPMYSVHAIRAVGVFDEQLFFGFDDLEYGLRLRGAGFGVYAHGELLRSERAVKNRLGLDLVPSRRLDEPTWRHYYGLRNLVYIMRAQGHHLGAARLVTRGLAKPVVNLPRRPRLAARHIALSSRAILDAYRGKMGRTVNPGAG
jgi:glycosyltransferase involved in cell wall biosynthesis